MVSKAAPAKILVVDDDPRERLSVSTIVSAFGYAVETAENGEEALEKIGGMSPDVIVTDLIMPR
ncbi:MAG: response regulator, partial [Bryobacteraceae bacterium]